MTKPRAGDERMGRVRSRRHRHRRATGRPLSRDVLAARVIRASRQIISSRWNSVERFRWTDATVARGERVDLSDRQQHQRRHRPGRAIQPRGLSLEAQDVHGRWIVVAPDLGFPAGKNKTILIDLGLVAARRHRARAAASAAHQSRDLLGLAGGCRRSIGNAVADGSDCAPSRAELRYRGFSKTDFPGARRPEIPRYDEIANVSARWRDLVGYYTRFGDVGELLDAVDDRYVIMNAGDELRLSFPPAGASATGWTRDFVLIGDGWEKDGDYNTTFSKTVLPLPSHDRPDYGASAAPHDLEYGSRLSASFRGLADLPHAIRHALAVPRGAALKSALICLHYCRGCSGSISDSVGSGCQSRGSARVDRSLCRRAGCCSESTDRTRAAAASASVGIVGRARTLWIPPRRSEQAHRRRCRPPGADLRPQLEHIMPQVAAMGAAVAVGRFRPRRLAGLLRHQQRAKAA